MSASLPRQWLNKASEDLVVARLVLGQGHTAHACFLAQQCIEKALKAYLIAKTNDHPRIHRLVDLLSLCIALDAALSLEIEDDGTGLSVERRAGVGLNSMRERAEELGGTCVVETAAMSGTTVRARLPLHF